MGGGQANKGQATAAANQATAANQASTNLSNENLAEQKQNYNYLFGDPSKSGSTGSLTSVMDPASLNTGTPTGAYQTAYTNATNTLAQNYAQQRGSLAQGWANNGFTGSTTPNGFQADQTRKLSNSQADSQGNLFASTVGQQHSDALTNFWNANNIASGQAASSRSGALQGEQNAGSDATGIYGTAGQYHGSPFASALGSGIQAGGQIGAAAMTGPAGGAAKCPAEGGLISTERGEVRVEELKQGDKIYQSNHGYVELPSKPEKVLARCVQVSTKKHCSIVSASHCFSTAWGGYTDAENATDKRVMVAPGGAETVFAVEDAGEREVFLMPSFGNNTYLCDGIWSLV